MAPESRDEVAQDEVRQRIHSLYDQAENATGNYNATRAMASVTRSRGVPLAKRSGRAADPALDEVARQWFEGARAKLGPTVPAVLPADRQPDRPDPAAGRSRDRGGLPGGAPDAPGMGPSARRREALERVVDRTVAELTAGRATDPESLALAARESGRVALTGSRRLELPSGSGESTGADGTGAAGASAVVAPDGRGVPAGLGRVAPAGLGPAEPSGLGPVPPAGLGTEPAAGAGPVETAVLPAAALPTAPGRPSPSASKANNQRKLAAASDVITRYTARLTTAAATAQTAPMTATAPEFVTATAPEFVTTAPPEPVTGIPPTYVTATPPTPMTATPSAPVTAAPPTPTAAAPWASIATAPLAPPVEPDSLDFATSQWQQPEWAASPAPATAVFPTPPAQTASPDPTTLQWQQPEWAASPAPITAVPPTPPAQAAPSDPTTGPWQQPEWAATGATATAMPAPVPEWPQATRAAKAIAFARGQVGKPCVWGATGPDSYDCSSLTQAAWKAAGVPLPRAAYQQALAGAPVTLAGIEPGDLVLFFDDDRHVGLHVGGGMMVHAPGPGASIREESIYGAGESAIHRIVRPA
ncbi:hypothetical protein SRB17_22500 [Streptomyces sp. RB17]|uniref:C40 family peptidase n=1 Tax=Streptomyces sp. RB17 TaxID=2585197 RepID=UPI001305BD1D|nr:hypothetical protein [Streptomyces sp. RB17]